MTMTAMQAAACVAGTIRPDVRAMSHYPVANDAGAIKLDAMESPYGLPSHVHAAVAQAIGEVELNRYPSADPVRVKAAVRAAFAIPDQAALMLGNGSDELINLLIQATCAPGDVVLAPAPSFVMYEVFARVNHARFVGVDLTAGFDLDLPAMLGAIQTHRPKVVFLASPNNPTGKPWPTDAIRAIVQAAPGLVVIDEAYHAFSGTTDMPLVLSHANVVLVRTVSKIGLAGIRLGYLAGRPEWVEQLDKLRPPYNLNVLTQAATVAVLAHKSILDEQAARINADRDALAQALAQLPGVRTFASAANFVLADFSAAGGGDPVFQALKKRRILVRNVGPMHRLLADCLRISVGTPLENAALLAALDDIIRN